MSEVKKIRPVVNPGKAALNFVWEHALRQLNRTNSSLIESINFNKKINYLMAFFDLVFLPYLKDDKPSVGGCSRALSVASELYNYAVNESIEPTEFLEISESIFKYRTFKATVAP